MAVRQIRGRGFWVELVSTDSFRQYMKFRGYSVQSMADRVGCSKAAIGHLHSGARKTIGPDYAVKIAEALNCPVEALFLPKVVPCNNTKRHPVAA